MDHKDVFDYFMKNSKFAGGFRFNPNTGEFKNEYKESFRVNKPIRVLNNISESDEIERIFCWLTTSVEKFLGGFEPSGINRKGILDCGSVLTIRKVFVAKSPQVLMKYLRVMVKNGWVREYRDSKGFPAFVSVEYDKLNYKSNFD